MENEQPKQENAAEKEKSLELSAEEWDMVLHGLEALIDDPTAGYSGGLDAAGGYNKVIDSAEKLQEKITNLFGY